jgi:hypothetical protein
LHLGCAAQRVDDAGELHQQAVAGRFNDPAPVLSDLGVDQLAPKRLQPFEGPFSIAASVKLRPDDFMLSPFCAPADDATRGPCFSSRSASGLLMMG